MRKLTGQPSKINRTAIARRQEQSALPIPALVAPPLPLPPLKFQLKMAYSWGKWQADAARDAA